MNIFTKRFDDDKLSEWTMPAAPSGANCVETAFTFLGLITPQECRDSRRGAKELPEITRVLQERSHRNYKFKEIVFGDLTTLKDAFVESLPRGHMTLVLLNRPNDIGHAVVIAADSAGKLGLIDPQLTWFPGDKMTDYLNDQEFRYPNGTYNLLVATSRKRLRSQNNGPQIRKHKTVKRRKTNGTFKYTYKPRKTRKTTKRRYTGKMLPHSTAGKMR